MKLNIKDEDLWMARLAKEVESGNLRSDMTETQVRRWIAQKKNVEKAVRYNKKTYDALTVRFHRDNPSKNYGLTYSSLLEGAKALGMSRNDFVLAAMAKGVELLMKEGKA